MQESVKSKKGFAVEHFKCEICQGYIIDATTLSDCLHPCKSLFCVLAQRIIN